MVPEKQPQPITLEAHATITPEEIVIDAILSPHSWSERLASFISKIGSPPVIALLGLISTIVTVALPGAWLWGAYYLLSAVVIPMLYILWLVHKGQVTDLDLHLREQRSKPFLVTLLGESVALLTMLLYQAPKPFILLTGAALTQTLLIFLITLRWKISVHTSTAASITILLWSLSGHPPTPLVIGIPLIAWSRIKLRRHTLAQTIAGTILGLTVFAVTAWVLFD
ncbi:MAG: phosphatase PAP2 family protein [Chloroflexota bacterium]|nr:phosphatase PAP2 family protein [Chloroflexota bacterium]